MKKKQKKTEDKKVTEIRKAIVKNLIDKKIDKQWIKNHLIITGL